MLIIIVMTSTFEFTNGEALMSIDTKYFAGPATPAAVAATRYVDADGLRFAYRSYGTYQPGQASLILLHRYRATMDDWDPAFIDALAAGRHVIAFDNRGIGASGGVVPTTLEQAADDAAAFAAALGLSQIDVLGWSMGGMTAQIMALRHAALVRRIVLGGTCPPGNPASKPAPDHWQAVASKPNYTDEDLLTIFFTKSEHSRALGRASLARMNLPGMHGAAVKTAPEVMAAHDAAIGAFWQNKNGWFERLSQVRQPALVANGDRDEAFPVTDSVVMAREIPNSRLAIYPDAAHGFLFQVPEAFASDVLTFLAT